MQPRQRASHRLHNVLLIVLPGRKASAASRRMRGSSPSLGGQVQQGMNLGASVCGRRRHTVFRGTLSRAMIICPCSWPHVLSGGSIMLSHLPSSSMSTMPYWMMSGGERSSGRRRGIYRVTRQMRPAATDAQKLSPVRTQRPCDAGRRAVGTVVECEWAAAGSGTFI
jgi:hypothetical protein